MGLQRCIARIARIALQRQKYGIAGKYEQY
jgi:hypothetical protein